MNVIDQNIDFGGRRSGQDRRVFADHNYKGMEQRIAGDRREGTFRRVTPRFRAKEGSYVAISSHNLIGLIKDINESGLAFQYFANGKKLTGMLTLDLFRAQQEFRLKNVRFKTISDFYIPNRSPFVLITSRQCAGNFVDLTGHQKSQLDHFIQKYTF
jgi:hypothetical protein